MIQGNWLGTNEAGKNFGNGFGISIESNHNIIGGTNGTSNGRGNIIGNNRLGGVAISTTGANNQLLGNLIGTNLSGDELGNSNYGVVVFGPNNIVGGLLSDDAEGVVSAGNVIAFNVGSGVSAIYSSVTGLTYRGNESYAHSRMRVLDLDYYGPGANDAGDADEGANNLQNHPEFVASETGYDDVSGELEIQYRVDSSPEHSAYPLVVDFYLRTTLAGETDVFVGSDVYPEESASQYRSVSIQPLAGGPPVDGLLMAFATDASGNTSEISTQSVPVPEPGQGAMLLAGIAALGMARRSLASRFFSSSAKFPQSA